MQILNMKPKFCCIAATDYCMLRCKMCNKWRERIPNPDEIPTIEEWKRFIAQFRALVDEGFELDFGGGEALSLPGILEMVKFAKEQGFRTTMASNGYLINKDMAKRIAAAGVDAISLSLDSPYARVHDRMRGVKGVYKRVMNALSYLTKYSPHTKKGLCCIIMNENMNDLIKLAHTADRDRRVDWLYFMAVVQPNYSGALDSQWHQEYNYLWPKDIPKLIGIIDSLIEMRQKGSKISNRLEHLRAYKAYFADPKKFVNRAKCMVGGAALSINTYGFIQLCFFMDFIGNIRKDDIRELWYSQDAQEIRKRVSECKTNCHLLLNCCYIEDDPSLYSVAK